MSEELKKNILVPWDFSEESEKALAHAYQLAQMVGDNVMLVHFIRVPFFMSANAKEKINSQEIEAQKKLKVEVERLSKQMAAKAGELRESLQQEAYQMRQVHDVTILPYVLPSRHLSKDLATLYNSMGVNLVVTPRAYRAEGGRPLDMLKVLRNVKSSRLTSVPFIIAKHAPTHRYYTDVVLPMDFDKSFKESLRWVAYLSNYYHCNVNIIKAAAANAGLKQGIASNTYFTKKIFSASNVVYGIKTADKGKDFREEIVKFVKEIDADMLLIMTDKAKSLFPKGEILIDVPVMFINPLSKKPKNFN